MVIIGEAVAGADLSRADAACAIHSGYRRSNSRN